MFVGPLSKWTWTHFDHQKRDITLYKVVDSFTSMGSWPWKKLSLNTRLVNLKYPTDLDYWQLNQQSLISKMAFDGVS